MFFLGFFLVKVYRISPGKTKTRAIGMLRAVTVVLQQEEEKKKIRSEHADNQC